MSSFKEPHLTASDCEDAPQSPKGTAALKQPSTPSPGSQDSYGGFCPTPQKRKHSTDERDTVVPRKLFCSSPEPRDSNGSASQEVQEPLLMRPPEESSSDGTVQQEVQDVKVDPLSDAQPELSGTTCGVDVSQWPAQIFADPDDKEAGVVLRQQPVQPALEPDNEEAKENVLPELISWKTLYNQYLEEVDHASRIVGVILQRYGLTKEHPQCMLGFIRCVAAVRTCHCEDPTAALTFLQPHSLHPKAEVCIARRLPDLDGHKERPAYVQAVMAAIVLFAGDVCHFQELMDCLQMVNGHGVKFPMSPSDILEILYSMATLFYAMRENEVQISNRFHYSVSYCLHYLENSLCSTPSRNDPGLPSSERGPRPISQPTTEQQKILNHKLKPGDWVKIVGFAGTGKTSTLLQYAREWSDLKFLIIVFNKPIQQQLSQFCPENVTCKTFHSLAYQEVGKNYRNKFIRDIQTKKVCRFLCDSGHPLDDATRIVQTLKAFIASADRSIMVTHTGFGEDVEEDKKQNIVEGAEQIWAKMKELGPPDEVAHRMTHDGYLKLWQIQNPSLSYDVIMVDEAQDCTHAMMDIVRLQKCAVILVGDPHQQIYTFRGAVNSLLNVPHSHIFYLTQSLRFGYEIAYFGATLLDVSRKTRKNTVGNYYASGVSVEGKETWLSRTNTSVFDNAVKVTKTNQPPKIHFLGDTKAVDLDIIEDLYNVQNSTEHYDFISNLIRSYVNKGFRRIEDYAATGDENKYNEHLPGLVDTIRECHVQDPESADYILGTVYKAKGLEFHNVRIDDDFMTKSNLERLNSNKIENIPKDDWNLLYVAVTRAKKRLILPKFFAQILEIAKEYCVQFELSTALCNTTPPICVRCSSKVPIPEGPVLIPKRINHPYIQADDTEKKGFLCPSCAPWILGPIAELAGSSKAEDAARLRENIEVPPEVHILLEDF